jgi:two-component system nitrogen regulation response regulator GlnG
MVQTALRVLFVDDDDFVRSCVGRYMQRLGVEVVQVSSAVEAYDALRREMFDAIVTDLRLPGTDGGEIVSTILAECPGGQHRVLVASGDLNNERARGLLALGCRGVQKPFDVRKLVKLISEMHGTRIGLRKAP